MTISSQDRFERFQSPGSSDPNTRPVEVVVVIRTNPKSACAVPQIHTGAKTYPSSNLLTPS